MLTFLLVGSLALALLGFGFLALPLLVAGTVLWIVLLPVKLLFGLVFGGVFRVLFGVLAALFGLIVAPLVAIVESASFHSAAGMPSAKRRFPEPSRTGNVQMCIRSTRSFSSRV